MQRPQRCSVPDAPCTMIPLLRLRLQLQRLAEHLAKVGGHADDLADYIDATQPATRARVVQLRGRGADEQTFLRQPA